jgi:hypothetical protein
MTLTLVSWVIMVKVDSKFLESLAEFSVKLIV